MSGEWPPRFDDEGGVCDPRQFIAFPESEDSLTVRVNVGGELKPVNGIPPREARDKLRQQMIQNGASPEYAERKTNTAIRRWDRGVREGSIKSR